MRTGYTSLTHVSPFAIGEGVYNCAKCYNLRGFHADKQVGQCVAHRIQVSTWHACRCDRFVAKPA